MKHHMMRYIEEHQKEMEEHLSALVSIPSVSDDLKQVKKALEYTLQLGENMGFSVENCLDGQVGVIELGDGEETLGILSHVDVVPAGDLEDWATNPFQAVVKDGRIYGRGTLDDKGMIVASLYAMKAVMESAKTAGIPLRKKVRLILGTQEEVEWTDMKAYTEAFPLPDYGFSPDGEYPVCNIEKGLADFTMAFPHNEHDGEIHCGTAKNTVPGKATAILPGGEEITVSGKSVHACQPEQGDNALFALWNALRERNLKDNQLLNLLQTVTETFEDLYGEKLGLYSESEFYQGEFVHRNTFSPTIFETKEQQVIVNINVRFPYGTDEAALKEKMDAFARGLGGSIISCDLESAVFVSKDQPFLKILAQAYEAVTGLKNEFTLAYGGSYAKAMPNIVSWGPIFPGEEDTCHEANEYIAVDSLINSTKIFAAAIAEIICKEESLKFEL